MSYSEMPLPGFPVEYGYRTKQVAEWAGITYRQIDHWTTKGLVSSSVKQAEGSGSKRLYAFEDVLKIKIVARLVKMGISLKKVEKAFQVVEELGFSLEDITIAGDSDENIYAIDDKKQVFDLLDAGQGVFLLTIEPLVAELEGQVASITPESASPIMRNEGGGYDLLDDDFDDFGYRSSAI